MAPDGETGEPAYAVSADVVESKSILVNHKASELKKFLLCIHLSSLLPTSITCVLFFSATTQPEFFDSHW